MKPDKPRALRALAGIVAVLVLCSAQGCWGKRELEDRSFVSLMGVDMAEGGGFLVTTVIPVPRALCTAGRMGGASDGGAQTVVILSSEGRNILEALTKIETINSRELSTVHLAFVVLGEEFARRDVGPIIDLFSRSLEFRHNTLVVVSKERAVDFLKGFQAMEESEPSVYLLKIVTTSHTSLGACPSVTMHDFMVGYNTLAIDPWAPYIGIASGSPADEAREPRRIAGILGTALFRKVGDAQRMVGYLDTRESPAALLMQGALHVAFLDVPYPGDQSETTLLIHHQSSSVNVSVADGAVKAKFILRMTASIEESQVATQQPETDQRFRQALVYTAEGEMEALLERVFLKLEDLGADVIGLGGKVQTKFGTYGEWEAFDWPRRFKDTTAVFDIKVEIPTAGFTMQKPYPK